MICFAFKLKCEEVWVGVDEGSEGGEDVNEDVQEGVVVTWIEIKAPLADVVGMKADVDSGVELVDDTVEPTFSNPEDWKKARKGLSVAITVRKLILLLSQANEASEKKSEGRLADLIKTQIIATYETVQMGGIGLPCNLHDGRVHGHSRCSCTCNHTVCTDMGLLHQYSYL